MKDTTEQKREKKSLLISDWGAPDVNGMVDGVTWKGCCQLCCSGSSNFQVKVVLDERGQVVELIVNDWSLKKSY